MTPTNDQLLKLIYILGQHVLKMEEFVFAISEGQTAQNKLIAARMPGFTDRERKLLLDAASKSETSLEHLEAAMKRYRKTFQACPFWRKK
jgi:hypothetical protein